MYLRSCRYFTPYQGGEGLAAGARSLVDATLDFLGGNGRELIFLYWGKALARYPELHFEKLHVLRAAESVTIIYNGVRGLSAEVFHFGISGKVVSAYAHYSP